MWLRATLVLLTSFNAFAQHSETGLSNPFQSPQDRAMGETFFRSQCAGCHGADGKGSANGPSLAQATFRRASDDEGLFRVITKGVTGTPMPGFALNGREIWQIVAHIRSLSQVGVSGQANGNPQNGAALFQSNGCARCHSGAGPNLTYAAERLSRVELMQSILDPDAEVAPQYWVWSAKLANGETAGGRRLNEDTYSVQYIDRNGRLRSLDKGTVQSQKLERRSPMPPFRDKLNGQQVEDLVAYLVSLPGASK